MKQKQILLTAVLLGFTGVLMGAMGSHGFEETLMRYGRESTYELAVEFQFYHVFALFATAFLWSMVKYTRWLKISGVLFLAGVILFSGSLYVLSLTGIRVLGAITPLGGLCFLSGWFFLLVALVRTRFGQ